MKLGETRFAALALLSALVFGGVAKADPNEGAIDIQSFLNAQGAVDNPIRVVRFSDSFLKQISNGFPPGDYHNVTSYFDGQDNLYDQRPKDNNESFLIRLIQNAPTTENKTSRLQFSFPYYPDYLFGNKPILFETDRLPYGSVVDIRRAIAQNSGDLPLIDAPIGTSGIYGTGILEIGTRLLADLDDSNEVNFEDFAIWAEDWQKGPGQYVGDICGPNGIPDGNADGYDLMAFSGDWLKEEE